jgi:large subunit ribosomal protein L3
MAGRMGGEKVTVKNLLVSKVDSEKNIIYVKGAVPGSKRGLITLRKP